MVLKSVRCDRAIDYDGSSLWSGVYKSVKTLGSLHSYRTFFTAKNRELLGLYPLHNDDKGAVSDYDKTWQI